MDVYPAFKNKEQVGGEDQSQMMEIKVFFKYCFYIENLKREIRFHSAVSL